MTKAEWLDYLRRSRGFDSREVIESKLGRLERFFVGAGLDAAVVGVSGGVDSALVLAMLRTLQRRGVLRRVVALLMPIMGRGATGQVVAMLAPSETDRVRRSAAVLRKQGTPFSAQVGEALESMCDLVRTNGELGLSVSRHDVVGPW
jgi:NH3-dependent NAD+ synthetase